MNAEFADRASVWIIVTASVTKRRHVLLRLINPPTEPKPEKRLGVLITPPSSYAHVPTISGNYDLPFTLDKAAAVAQKNIPQFWPALAPALNEMLRDGKLPADNMVQTPVDWGGIHNDKPVPTSMLHIDLGSFKIESQLPKISVKTDRIADTTFWVRADNIFDTKDLSGSNEGFYTQYRLTGERILGCQRQLNGPLVTTTIRDLGVQRTIALAIEQMAGVKIDPVAPGFKPRPRVVFAPVKA